MNKKIQTLLGVLAVVLIAGGVGFYIYNDISLRKESIDMSQDNQDGKGVVVSILETATTTGGTDSGDKGYKVEVVSIPTASTDNPKIPVPGLNRKIVFSKNTSDEAKSIITEKINKIVEELKKNSSLPQDWISLGLYRKVAGDYEGARDAWEYAGAVSPENSVSFRNLGDLYGYYLNDSKKAEENLLKAIENDPNQIEYYFKITEFYKNVLNDMDKARQIVQQGIAANPASEELKSLLTSLK